MLPQVSFVKTQTTAGNGKLTLTTESTNTFNGIKGRIGVLLTQVLFEKTQTTATEGNTDKGGNHFFPRGASASVVCENTNDGERVEHRQGRNTFLDMVIRDFTTKKVYAQ